MTKPESAVHDHASRAEAAANRQEYQQASELFAQAVSTVGLEMGKGPGSINKR